MASCAIIGDVPAGRQAIEAGRAGKHMRTNEAWLMALRSEGPLQQEALAELRQFLFRAVLVYLQRHRSDVVHLDPEEIEGLAEDSTQEALVQILAKLDTFRGEGKFTTWAYKFVINLAASELRLRCWTTLSLDTLRGEEEFPLLKVVEDLQIDDPERALERRQVLELVQRIIDEDLSERQRLAIVAIHFHGVPVEEAAARLETNRNNLYKLMHDARKRIKQRLIEHHLSEGDILALFGQSD